MENGSPYLHEKFENYDTAVQGQISPSKDLKAKRVDSAQSNDFSDHVIGQVLRLQTINMQKKVSSPNSSYKGNPTK